MTGRVALRLLRTCVEVGALTLCGWSGSAAQQPQPLALEPLLDAPRVAAFSPAAFSPDGRMLAYVVVDPVRSPQLADTTLHRSGAAWFGLGADIWLADLRTGDHRKLTAGRGSNWSPSWSPDGSRLAFLADRGAEPAGPARLWLWERATDSLWEASDADVREGYHGLHWTGDGSGVVVTLFPSDLQPAAYAALLAGAPASEPDDSTSVRIFEFDPAGDAASPATDQVNLDLWRRDVGVIEVRGGTVRRLLSGARVFAYVVSPDGNRVAYARFAGAEPGVPGQYRFDLVAQSTAGGEPQLLAAGVFLDLLSLDGSFSWSPRGDRLAFRTGGPAAADELFVVRVGGAARRVAEGPPAAELAGQLERPVWHGDGESLFITRHGELWRAPADGSGARAFARDSVRHLSIIAPRQQRLWSPDGRSAILATHDPITKRTGLVRMDLGTGRLQQVLEEDRRWGGYGTEPTIAPEGSALAYVAEDPRQPPDFWVYEPGQTDARRVSDVAPALHSMPLGTARVIEWRSNAGDTLHGALVLPAGYVPGRRYPLIVKVYGGSSISNDLNRFGFASTAVENLQLFATRDYALLLADSKLRVGTPMSDIAASVLPGIDEAVRLGVADASRIGVMGHSYGGYSTLSLIVQSPRFRAAVMRAGMGNLISSYGQLGPDGTNYGLAWAETGQGRMGGTPWALREQYILNSPVFFLDRVETPLLIVHGSADDAVPPFLADEIFTGLRRLGKRVTYARYEGEGHWEGGWSRSNQRDVLARIISWFDQHLKEAPRADQPQS